MRRKISSNCVPLRSLALKVSLQTGRLFSRIDKYDFDTVLWHQPDRAAKQTVPQLKDGRVHVIGVSDRWFPSIRCRYEVQRESAIKAILRDWRQRGYHIGNCCSRG